MVLRKNRFGEQNNVLMCSVLFVWKFQHITNTQEYKHISRDIKQCTVIVL